MARYYSRTATRYLVGGKPFGPSGKSGEFYVYDAKDGAQAKVIKESPGYGRQVFDADKYDADLKSKTSRAEAILKEYEADPLLLVAVNASLSKVRPVKDEPARIQMVPVIPDRPQPVVAGPPIARPVKADVAGKVNVLSGSAVGSKPSFGEVETKAAAAPDAAKRSSEMLSKPAAPVVPSRTVAVASKPPVPVVAKHK